MAKVISLINLKGGVGKTTTTIQLAECLASNMFKKRVLVIDLDPQTNATIALIDEKKWLDLNGTYKTIFHLFNDQLEHTNYFSITEAIQKRVSNLRLPYLDLLSSSIDLINIQDRIKDIPEKSNFTLQPTEILRREINKIKSNYDYILIDCPPSLGLVTQNGLEISDYYLIPTIPDKLSTWGIPQIIQQIDRISQNRSLSIKCLGLVFTKVEVNKRVHSSTMDETKLSFPRRFDKLPLHERPTVFETYIPQANKTAEALDYFTQQVTFKSKYGHGDLWRLVEKLTKEVVENAI